MDLGLKGKTALITGSDRGTGKKIAEILHQEGATVVLHGFSPDKVKQTAQELKIEHFVAADITTDQGAETLYEKALSINGHLELLVNNYGTGAFGKWSSTSSEDWLEIYQKNTLSAVRMIRLALPHMRTQLFGRIIQIGTVGSVSPNKVMPHYYASKAALANMTVSLAKETQNCGITVNTISPGLIKTAELETLYRNKAQKKGWGESWAEIEKQIVQNDFPNPVGRIARREDIAHLVAFLCSQQASFINGQNIRVDGGFLDIV